ncbi:MAG: hypothetical protein ABSA46_02395 [Thermodesulfovibrionales bacterium]
METVIAEQTGKPVDRGVLPTGCAMVKLWPNIKQNVEMIKSGTTLKRTLHTILLYRS